MINKNENIRGWLRSAENNSLIGAYWIILLDLN